MEHGVGDGAVVHQHRDAPADADDQRDAQKIRAAGHKGVRDLIFSLAVDQTDDDAAHQKQGAELREPPAENRQRQAHLVKGNDGVDHQEERQGKDRHDDLPLGGKGHRLIHCHVNVSGAHAHHGFGGILFHLGRVGHHKPDGGGLKDNPLNDPQQNAIPQGHPGKARRDARCKGVHRGADDAGPGAQQNNGDAHHRVIARRKKHRNQQRIKGHGLLPHAVGGAAQAEQQHQNGDQPLLPAAQALDDAGDARIHRAGFHHNAQEPAHHQNEHAHIHGVVKAGEGRLQHIAHPLGVRVHRVVGARHRHAVHVVIGACRDHPGGRGHQDDQQKEDGIGGGHAEFGVFHLPMVATITALMVCIRFSASSKTTLWRPRNTSSVTSRISTPLSCHSLASLVSKSWKEGRQCI